MPHAEQTAPADQHPEPPQYAGLFQEPQYPDGPYALQEDDDTEG